MRPVRRSRSRTGPLTWASRTSIERARSVGDEIEEHVGRRDVEVGGRREVDEHARRFRLQLVDELEDLQAGDVGVEEVERRVEAHDQRARGSARHPGGG